MATELIDDGGFNSVGWFYETFNACLGLAPSRHHRGSNNWTRGFGRGVVLASARCTLLCSGDGAFAPVVVWLHHQKPQFAEDNIHPST